MAAAMVMMRLVRQLLFHGGLLVGAILTLSPLAWMISASLMSPGEATLLPPHLIPETPTFGNYRALFLRLDLAKHFLNSAVVTAVAVVGSMAINTMAGYAFAKLEFPGRSRVFGALTVALIIPAQVGMLPLFLLLREMGFVNTYAGVIIPYLASVFGIFLIRQYLVGIPSELLQAARVDGASELRVFWTIVVPIIRPILATLATFTFLSAWNDFMWPLIVVSDSDLFTLPVALASLVGEHVQDTELMMAGSVITTLPALVVFLLFQRAYTRGILAGSVKG